MTADMQLVLDIAVQDDAVTGDTIQDRFESFNALNPWVLESFERMTADYLSRGHARIGIGMLTEVLRWHYSRQTAGDAFKINNDYRSRYVRLLIERHPEWADAFQCRTLKAA